MSGTELRVGLLRDWNPRRGGAMCGNPAAAAAGAAAAATTISATVSTSASASDGTTTASCPRGGILHVRCSGCSRGRC